MPASPHFLFLYSKPVVSGLCLCVVVFFFNSNNNNKTFSILSLSHPINAQTSQVPGAQPRQGPGLPSPGSLPGKYFLASVQTCSPPVCRGSCGLLRLRRGPPTATQPGEQALGKLGFSCARAPCPNRNLCVEMQPGRRHLSPSWGFGGGGGGISESSQL